MSGIFGSLNISDSDFIFNSTVGQRAIYDAAAAYVERVNAELNAAMSVFVERTTDAFQERYKLPGGGYLQRRGVQGKTGNVKASGSWDVAYPLEDFGASMGWNDVDYAYMTVAELDRHIMTVTAQNVNTVRFEMLKALLNNTADSFIDPVGHGTLTIQPLANNDAVVYPPVLGATAEAADDHYLESSYVYTAISDTNNPYTTMANELEEHFGAPTGGSNMAIFQPSIVTPYTRALTDFVPVKENGVVPGSATDMAAAYPAELARIGRVIGYMSGSGVWVVEWRYLPIAATPYMLGVHLDAPKPLIRRIDPAATGLGDGLQLVSSETEHPFSDAEWRHRFGFGVGNRLNGVVMELAAGAGYTVPPAYA